MPAFKPQWDARMGAQQLYTAYQASKVTLEEFEGPRYQRIAHIRKLMAEGIVGPDMRFMPVAARSQPSPSLRAATPDSL